MFVNTDEDQDFDASGKIETEHGEYMMWSRKRTDKNNNPFTRASIAPVAPKANSNQSEDGTPVVANTPDLDGVDDIPF